MKITHLLMPTLRDVPSDAEVMSHQLLLRGGFIRKLAAGIYSYLPLGLRVIKRVEQIIREEMHAVGAQEILMPMVQTAELWQESGRWEVYGKELLRFKDRHDNDYCLGPTHEEVVTDIFRKNTRSYKELPLSLYQIQTKFRDEIRPRFGLMRGREFIMKDCYSFDRDEASAMISYQRYYDAYKRIFERCGLKFRAVEAQTGVIGGSISHEFQVLADTGEDALVGCTQCEYAANQEKTTVKSGETCDRCKQGRIEEYRGIEVGQVFYLGDKYSKALQATYVDEDGSARVAIMGCYGIGVGRTAAAAIEQNHDDKGMIWPRALAPYSIGLIPLGDQPEVLTRTQALYDHFRIRDVILWDDRDERAGVKFNDMDLIGIPLQVVVSPKGLEKKELEIKDRASGKKVFVPIDQVTSYLEDQLA